MHIVPYQKPVGAQKIIEDEYYASRNINNRYTKDKFKEWKKVDLYFILGIDSLRDEPIPESLLFTQYRKQMLKYHPDADKTSSVEAFLIIKKAYTILKNPVSRRKFDSIYFDEELPEDIEYEDSNFFKVFGEVFDRNAKFSNNQPVPKIGDIDSTQEEIENFYRFWKTFDSWRTFEYTDAEDYEGMSRDERKYHEKKNKSNRDKLKNADILRMRKLVEISLKRDPRVQKYRSSELTKKVGNMSFDINPKLLSGTWKEDDLRLLNSLMTKHKKGTRYDTGLICENFNKESSAARTNKELMIKINEISRMGIKKK